MIVLSPMAATTSSSSTSSSCSGFFSLRSSNSGSSSGGCGKIDGVAMWIINGVTMAFFASLNRCSCIRIATDEEQEDANDLPLMLNDGNILLRHDHDATSSSRRRTGKGKSTTAGSGAPLVLDQQY